MRLKLRATLYVLERPPGAKTAVRRMIQYAVEGLPSNRRALIARRQERWQMLRQEDGVVGCWEGDYPTADVALSAVEAQAFLDVAAAHVSVAEADRLVFGLLRSGRELTPSPAAAARQLRDNRLVIQQQDDCLIAEKATVSGQLTGHLVTVLGAFTGQAAAPTSGSAPLPKSSLS